MRKWLVASKNLFLEAERRWNRFWFELDADRPWRVLRRLLCGVLFLFYLSRLPDLFFTYSEGGMFPRRVVADLISSDVLKYRWSLLHLSSSNAWLIFLYLLLLATLAGLVAGIKVRWLAVLAWILQVSFLHRAMYTLYGFDKVMTVFLAYLALSGGGQGPRWARSLGMRLMQVQILVIYTYSGLEKLKGVSWWKGEALWWVISNPQQVSIDLTWVARFPALIALPTCLTVIWEIYFAPAMMNSQTRYGWLAIGVAFHLGIAVYLNIPFFGVAMIFSYVALLSDSVLDRISRLPPGKLQLVTHKILK